MPWKRLIAGMQKIVGSPGPNGLMIDRDRLNEFRGLMRRTGLSKLRSRDIADGYLGIIPGKQRHGKGVYYTPQQVVEFILDQVLPQPRFGKNAEDPYPEGFRVLEPACGAGYFLLAAYRRFRDSYRKAGIEPADALRRILTDRLAAVDIDGSALLVAVASLLQEVGDEIDPTLDSGPIRLPFFRADFLDKHYDTSPTELGRLLSGGFPAIVGNPPYVSFYAKRAKPISESDRRYYRENYRTGSGRINTYCLFVERAFDLLTPSGVLGFIVPNTLLIMKSYEPLRRYLLENGWLKSVVDLSLKVFPEVEVPTCVMAVERRDPRALQFPRKVATGFWESARGEYPSDLEETDQVEFEKLPYSMFNIHIRSADREVLESIERAGKPLGESFEVRDGINPANMTGKIVLKSMDELPLPYRPVLRGKDIGPYQLSWDNLWVRYDPSFIDKSSGEYCFFREERIFTEKPKILTRQTADRIVAAFDESGFYALNTLHVTIPLADGMNLKCLLALYNSRLLNYYYRLVFPDTERLFPQVKTVNVEKLPIPDMDGHSERLTTLVDKLLAPQGNDSANGRRQKLLDEIDSLIYGLYELKPDHIARIERSPYTFSAKSHRR
jgi:hypothetical protein